MEEKILLKFGLTRNEINIYLTLLKTGNALAGELTKKTGIHRRNVYDSLERLMEKGLISNVIINNKKLFSPANPKRFLNIIEEKKHNLDTRKKEFEKILPKLNIMKPMTKRQDVRFFKGVEGLKTVYEDILRTGKDYVGYGPVIQLEKVLKSYLKHFVKRRKEQKIKTRLIYAEKERDEDFVKSPLSEARFFPDKFSTHVALRIYGNNLVLQLLAEDEPLAIVIENRKIANGYKNYFEIMWNAAKR